MPLIENRLLLTIWVLHSCYCNAIEALKISWFNWVALMPDSKCQMCLRLFLELRVVPVFIVTGVPWRYTTCLRWKREFLSSHLCKPRNIPAWMTVPSCRFWASVSPSLVLELWKGKFPAKPGVCTQRMWLHDWAYDNQRLPCRNARTLWLTRCLASCCAAWDVTKQPQPTLRPNPPTEIGF